MKKRLLSATLAMVCAMGAYAASVGDYIYSNTSRYKVQGVNQVTNGDFSKGITGWTADDGKGIDEMVWAATTVDGKTAIQSQQLSTEAGKGLSNVWSLPYGTYVYSYWAKAESGIVTGTTTGNSNCALFYASTDGATQDRVVSEAVSIGTEWTHVVDTIVVNAEQEYLCMTFSGMPTGTAFTDFEIYKAEEVYDIRIVERLIAYAESLLQEPDLQAGGDDFTGIVMTMKAAIQDPSMNESAEAMEGLIGAFNVEFDNFMNANGGNTKDIVGTWEKQGYLNVKNLTKIGSWVFEGGRWGFSPNDGSLDRPEGDGQVATALIQTGYTLDGTKLKVENSELKPGKYFFSIEAQAVGAGWSKPGDHNWSYGSNHNIVFEAPTIFVGSDSLVLETDTMTGYYWKRYYYIAEVKEGETVRAGFIFPNAPSGTTPGGRFSVRNPEFRMLGKTELQLGWESAVKAAYTQQVELKKRLDTYKDSVAALLWEQDSLDRAIIQAKAVYEASLAKVTGESESTVAVSEEGIEELNALQAELLAEVNAMGRAINWVISQNAIQDDLKAAIVKGQAVVDDPLNAGGDATLKTALKTAISEAQALVDGLSATNQYDAFKTAIENINKAIEAFKITAASRANPANITILNPDFAQSSGNTTSTSFTKDGWNFTGTGTYKQWQFGTAGEASYANQWRGSTVTLGGKAQQAITLTQPGLYEYRAKAYATNDNQAYRMGTAQSIYNADDIAIDTTYAATPARLFFGIDGRPDSIVVSKCIAPNNAWNGIDGYTGWTYSVFFVKTGTDEVTVEIGLEVDPLDVGKGLCAFGFGYNQVLFVGDEAKYKTDTKADLDAAVAKANTLIATYENSEDFGWLCVKLKRYIADAQAATTTKAMQNAYTSINEIYDLITVTTGVDTVITTTDAGKVSEGIYSLTGVKLNAAPQKGIYIVNGKKVVIK